jgi:hypothetical protein
MALSRKTRRSLAEVKEALKRQVQEERAVVLATQLDRELRRGSDLAPPRRWTKKRGPMTRDSRVTFGANLYQAPQGPKRWVPGQIVHQIYHDKTGCRLATMAEEGRIGMLRRWQGEWQIVR